MDEITLGCFETTMVDASKIPRELIFALDELASRWRLNNFEPLVDWTADVKLALHEAAADRYEVRSSSYPKARSGLGEWLFDMSWILRDEEGRLADFVLACESEWSESKAKIDEDFQKLLVARASLRAMIFEKSTQSHVVDALDDLRKQIIAFRGTRSGDRYLLTGFNNDHSSFAFTHDLFVVP